MISICSLSIGNHANLCFMYPFTIKVTKPFQDCNVASDTGLAAATMQSQMPQSVGCCIEVNCHSNHSQLNVMLVYCRVLTACRCQTARDMHKQYNEAIITLDGTSQCRERLQQLECAYLLTICDCFWTWSGSSTPCKRTVYNPPCQCPALLSESKGARCQT